MVFGILGHGILLFWSQTVAAYSILGRMSVVQHCAFICLEQLFIFLLKAHMAFAFLVILTMCLFTLKPTIKYKPRQQMRWLDFSNSQLPLHQYQHKFQHHHRMEFTFHNSYVILELGYSDFLKSSLQNFYDRHPNLVDSYEISISQMTMDLLFFT